jgi:hypothetical protein
VGEGVTGSLEGAMGVMSVFGKAEGGSGRVVTNERGGAGEAWKGVVISGKGSLTSLGSESLPMSQPDRVRLAL